MEKAQVSYSVIYVPMFLTLASLISTLKAKVHLYSLFFTIINCLSQQGGSINCYVHLWLEIWQEEQQ